MVALLEHEKAGPFLQSIQRLRVHWSNILTQRLVLAFTINVGIWTYIVTNLAEYLNGQINNPVNIILAASVSCFLIGLWRFDAHDIDYHISGLYPDLLLAEYSLDVPFDHGTSGYLIKAVPKIKDIFSNEIQAEDKINIVSILF